MPADEIPRLSIMMPTYGWNPYLKDTLASLAANDRLTDVELVIQNGGCSVADIVSSHSPVSTVLIEEPDEGQADALNRASSICRGEYLGWLNSDDIYYPHALDRVLGAIESAGPDLIFGDFELIQPSGRVMRCERPLTWSHDRLLRRGCYIFSGAAFLKKSLWESVGGLDASLNFVMDYDLFLRLPRNIEARYIPQKLGALVVHSESKTGAMSTGFIREGFTVVGKAEPGVSGRIRALLHAVAAAAVLFTQPVRHTNLYTRLRRGRALV